MSAIVAMRLGWYTNGISFTISLPWSQKLKAPRSAIILSPAISLAIFLCWRSLAMDNMWNDLNNLRVQIRCKWIKKFLWLSLPSYVQISGDHLYLNSSPLNYLPQVLDTARKVNFAIEGVQMLTTTLMCNLLVVNIKKLTKRMKALSVLPEGKMFCKPSCWWASETLSGVTE